MYDLVVIGSPSFDRVVRKSILTHERLLSGPSIVTAVAAARLGIENMVVIGSLSSQDSTLFENASDMLGVPEYFRIDSPVSGGFEVEYNDGAEPLFTKLLGIPKAIGIRDIPEEFLSTRYILLSPLLQEISAELIEWLCNSSDAIILMDPQLRKSETGDKISTLKELEIASKTSCFLDFIKPNEQEAFWITDERDPFVAAEILVDTLAENCIITRGVHGSIVYDGNEFKIIPSYKVQEIDTFGAGATFFAGFISGLLDGKKYDFCAALGASAASFKVSGEYPRFALDRNVVYDRANEITPDIKRH